MKQIYRHYRPLCLIVLALALVLAQPETASAASLGIGYSQDELDNSASIQILRAVFGGIVYASAGNLHSNDVIDTPLAAMAMVFNTGVFIGLAYLLVALLIGKILISGNNGRVMSERYNDTMVVVRSLFSFVSILPVVSGFNLAQVLVMSCAVMSNFIADEVNKAGNEFTYTTGDIGSYAPNRGGITDLLTNMLSSELCASAINSYYVSHPDFNSKYKISFKRLDSTVTDEEVNYSFGYQNQKGVNTCGMIDYHIGNDKFFGAMGDPTGQWGDMDDYQIETRNYIASAHSSAVVAAHNTLSNAITAGLVVPGENIDSKKLNDALSRAKKAYFNKLKNILLQRSASLSKKWDEQVNGNKDPESSLAFAAKSGWIYNGLTWMDKSRIETFISKISSSIPKASGATEENMENAFIEERWTRIQNIIDSNTINNANKFDGSKEDVNSNPYNINELSVSELVRVIIQYHDVEKATSAIGAYFTKKVLFDTQFNFKDYDPITNLQNLGHRMLDIGWSAVAIAASMEVTEEGTKIANGSLLGKMANIATFGTSSKIAKSLSHLIEKAAELLIKAAVMFIAVGTLLAYWLPAVPFLMWDLAVLGTYLLVGVAFLSATLWLAANALPNGEGWSSDNARQGWLTLINILSRPSIIVMSWHISLLLMTQMGNFTSILLSYIPTMNSDAIVGVWGQLSSFVVFIIMEYVIANRCLTLIYEIPDQLPLYYGGQNVSTYESAGEGRSNSIVAGWSSHTQSFATSSIAKPLNKQ